MSVPTIREHPSPNHAARGASARITTLVLHYTGMASAADAIARLCDPAARVSAHYLVEEDGAIWRLVPEARRAFHAGVSCWAGEGELNAVSIGIEIANPGHEWGYRPFPPAQMAALAQLCRDLLLRHAIPSDRIVGHSDIAPERKADPGELFDWAVLADAGIGLWPPPHPSLARRRGRGVGVVERAGALADLAAIGYCVLGAGERAAVAAFQRRFRQDRWDGWLDGETVGRLAEVRAAYDASRRRRRMI